MREQEMAKGHSRTGPSQRQRRVNELLRHALADVFLRADVADQDLKGAAVTVTEVQVSPDLRNARIYIVPLGGANQEQVVAALNRHQKYLRGEVARRVTLKYMPALSFELDIAFDSSDRVEALLRSQKVAQDLG